MRPRLSKLFHPYASAILLALLLADAWFLTRVQSWGGDSVAGNFIRQNVLREHTFICGMPGNPVSRMFVRERSGQTRSLAPDDESWDEGTRVLQDTPREVLMISYNPLALSTGFWAPTTRTDRHILKFQFGEHFSPEERAAARVQYVERCGAAFWLSRSDFQTLTTADIDRTRPILLGYLHNTLAIAALILFLVSLRWVPKTPAYIRTRIGAHRLSRGLCPRCSYNLHGLREPKCPECGAAIPEQPQMTQIGPDGTGEGRA